MESRAKFAGHAIHPMLIVLPLVLLSTAVVFDILHLITDNDGFATSSWFMIAAGIVGGLLAAVFGLVDWLAIPAGTRAKGVGLWHAGGNVVVLLLFVIAWLLRQDTPAHRPGAAALVLELVATLVALGSAWLGGELVERLRVGVDEGAHLDAPSSLRAAANR